MKAGGTHMDNMECQLAKTSIWLTKAVTVLFHMIAGKISTSLCSYWPPSDFDRLKHTFPRFPNQRMSVAARCLLHLKDQSTYSVVNNPVCKVPIVPFTAGNISKITILTTSITTSKLWYPRLAPKARTKICEDQRLPSSTVYYPLGRRSPPAFDFSWRGNPRSSKMDGYNLQGLYGTASSCQIPSHHVTSAFFFPMVETIEDCHLMKTDLPGFWDQRTNRPRLKAKAFEAHPVEQSKACKSAWRSSLGTDEQQKKWMNSPKDKHHTIT